MKIPFNQPFLTGKEFEYISEALKMRHLSGDGCFTKKCNKILEKIIGCKKALLTTSCTSALEMVAILGDINIGDEVIMPSYTFVSTANAFVLRGAIPVFVDIRPDTLNIDETKIEEAITDKTKAIVVVHYAGIACEMDTITNIAKRHNLLVIEDAAQAICSEYKGRKLGSIGHMATLSFHETKNIICGEGGALLINDEKYIERAEIIREKGTNRSKFFRGEVDKYTWVDIGSSYLPGEILSAFLSAQLEQIENIIFERHKIWNKYNELFSEISNIARGPIIPENVTHNAHLYYLLLSDIDTRSKIIEKLKQNDISAVFHYIPLHSSPAGLKYGKTKGNLPITDNISQRLLRLPFYIGLSNEEIKNVYEIIKKEI